MMRCVVRFAIVTLVATCATVIGTPALAGTHRGTKFPRSDPTTLWSAFPLNQRRQPTRGTRMRGSALAQVGAPVESQSSGRSSFRLLVALATLLGAGFAALIAVLLLRSAPSLQGRGRARSVARLPLSPVKGGSSMANLKRKLWTLAGTNASPEQAEEQAGGEGWMSRSSLERVSAYSAKENEPVPVEENAGVASEPAREERSPEADVPADLAVVGEEVGTVLKSAQEAAARIRTTAHEEAERLRAEAASAAEAELEEASRIAEAERADASRIRVEAEAYAKDAFAAADAFAEQQRSEADRGAAQIVSDAQKRVAAADAEVEQKLAQAGAKARERQEALQLEVKRYEKRLESILVVFHGMSSQLEDLLGRGQAESGNAPEVSDDTLEDAVRPDGSSSRVG